MCYVCFIMVFVSFLFITYHLGEIFHGLLKLVILVLLQLAGDVNFIILCNVFVMVNVPIIINNRL